MGLRRGNKIRSRGGWGVVVYDPALDWVPDFGRWSLIEDGEDGDGGDGGVFYCCRCILSLFIASQ